MRYEDYRGPEIQDEPKPYVPLPVRIVRVLALACNIFVTVFFSFTTLGFWLGWREGGSPVYYYGIYTFAAITLLSVPPLGSLLRKRLGARAARWIRWGGCFVIYLLFVAVIVP